MGGRTYGLPSAGILDPADPRHGAVAGYRAHRKMDDTACVPCRRAWRLYHTRNRLSDAPPRKVSSRGVRRRIEALRALGWTEPQLCAEMGIRFPQAVRNWTHSETVTTRTYDKVAALYERLSMTPPPAGKAAEYARTVGRRNGFVPPLGWDDIDNDPEPADMGSTRKTWPAAELAAEVAHLLSMGESVEQAARRLGLTTDAIEKAHERAA